MKAKEKTREQMSHELAELRQQLAEANRRIVRFEGACKLLDISSDSIFLLDADGVILTANQAGARRLGKEVDEIVGQCTYDLLPPDVAINRKARNEKVLRTGEPVSYEDEREGIHFDTTVHPVRDTAGNVVQLAIFARDITRRKQIENTLKESEERFRSVVENSHTGILILDNTYRFTYANDELCRIAGRSREEVIGHDFREFLDEETKEMVVDRYVHRQRGEKVPPRYEFNLTRKDGEKRRVEVSSSVIKDSSGRVRTVGQLLDITERARAEEELRQSEERFRRAVLDAPFPIMIHAEDGEVVQISQAWTELTGYEHSQIPTITDWAERAYGQRKELVRADIDRLYDLGTKVHEGEYVITTSAGEARTWEFSSAPLGQLPDGRRLVISMAMDVTEHKRVEEALRRSEERYALAQRAASIGSWDWNIQTGELHWSDEIEPMFGFGRGEFGATYEAFLESVHPEDRQYVVDSVDACVEEKKDYGIEHRIVWPDGTVRWVSETGDVIRDEDGKAIRMLGVVQDVTERVRSEKERAQAEEALKESEEKLRLIFEHAFDGISIHEELPGRSRRLLDCNERYTEMAGRSKQELLEIGNTSLVQEDLGPMRSLAENLRLRSERTSYEGLFSWKRPDGKENVIEYSAAPIQVGERALTIGIDRDVTERIQVEAIRAQAEEEIAKLARFPNENPYPVLRIAQDGAVLYANEASAPLLNFWGCHIDQCLPDDWQRLIRDALRSESSTEVEFEIQGQIFSLTFAPVMEEGYVNVYALDITERKRVEEELRARERYLAALNGITRAALETPDLRTMLQTLSDRLGDLIDADGCYITLWDETRQMTIPMAAYGEWQGDYSAMRPEPGEVTVTESVLRVGHSLVIEDVFDTPYLSPRIAELFPDRSLLALPLIVGDQKLGAALIAFDELHHFTSDEIARGEQAAGQVALAVAKARLVEALRLHAAELEARNAELDAFAHTVAHDLKNPLGLAIGYAKLLQKEHPTLSQEDMDQYLHTVVQNGYKMNAIIDELLLLSEVRKADAPKTPLDMATVVAEAQQRLVHAIEEHQAEIVAPERWPQALGYGPWVEEVWANYLDNAIKYGGRPPRIQLGAEVEPDNRVRFWVRDNGPGLEPEEQARLFTPFDRLGQVHAKGHGLGLSIVRRIVEKLDGQVGVESKTGQGSMFWFTLPGDGRADTSPSKPPTS